MDALRRATTRFYRHFKSNPFLSQFVRSWDDPHPDRLATWIAEKMGDKDLPWTTERRTRNTAPKLVGGGHYVSVHDRSSAHVAAWNSPHREPGKMGRHFKLDDCRVWMRLNFWAFREEGLLDHPAFASWYVRFIAHFVRVYEATAPAFARSACRWSENPENIRRYKLAMEKEKKWEGKGEDGEEDDAQETTAKKDRGGKRRRRRRRGSRRLSERSGMSDIIGLSLSKALAQLPEAERNDAGWPYHAMK